MRKQGISQADVTLIRKDQGGDFARIIKRIDALRTFAVLPSGDPGSTDKAGIAAGRCEVDDKSVGQWRQGSIVYLAADERQEASP